MSSMSHCSSFGWMAVLVIHVKKNCRALGRYDGTGVSLALWSIGSEGQTRSFAVPYSLRRRH